MIKSIQNRVNRINRFLEKSLKIDNIYSFRVFEDFYLMFGILFFIFSVISFFLGLYFSAISKLILSLVLISYFIRKFFSITLLMTVIMTIYIGFDLYLFSAFTYHFFNASIFWYLLIPVYIFAFIKEKISIFLIVFILITALLVSPINSLILEYYDVAIPSQNFIDCLRWVTYICIFLFVYLFIGKYKQLHNIDYQELILKNNELEKIKSELIDSQSYKLHFFSMISHEIRTPLNAIIGVSKLIEKDSNVDIQVVKSLKNSSEHLHSIVNDFLEYNRIQNGEVEIDNANFNIEDILDRLKTIINFQLKEKNLPLYLDIDEKVPKFLYGDGRRLIQVLVNLVSNAIKFTNKGSISVRISLLFKDDLDCFLLIKVIDTGIGISQERLEDLFQTFSQKNISNDKNNSSTGLGLSITKKIIEAQNGEINVESELNKGSVFSIKLKYIEVSEKQITKTQLKKTIFIKPNLKILVVDDNEINLIIAKKQLKLIDKSTEVKTVNNGKDAIQLIEENNYDILLIDIRMPVMNGIETTKRIRAKFDGDKNLPIIAVTADITEETSKECKEAGIDDVVSKPFILEDLVQSINNALNE